MGDPAAVDAAASLFMSHTVAMRRVHGIVLLAAWCLLAPIAISLMALTKTNPKLRSRVFLPHAAIQVFVLLLTCVGVTLGLLLPVAGRTPHKCVGYLTLALALFPLTAALWRPKVKAGVEGPGSGSGARAALRRRRLWEGFHRASGLAAVAAAFVDGALGVRRTWMRPRCVPAAIMGAGIAVLTCTYGFKLFEAAVLLRKKRGPLSDGEGAGGEHGRTGAGVDGGDAEKAPPPLAPSSSKQRASSLEEYDDSACAKTLGEPGFGLGGGGGGGGGRRRGGETKGGGDKEEEESKENKEKSDSFDSASGCLRRDSEP